jgi:DnaJ-class molecular chaperone
MSVYYCLGCDDQPPWKSDDIKPCPTCKTTGDVTAATRFQNLTTDKDGHAHVVYEKDAGV